MPPDSRTTTVEVPTNPFTGALMHFPQKVYWQGESRDPIWVPNTPFDARLEIEHMLTGRSAKYVMLRRSTEAGMPEKDQMRWPMFVADLIAAATTYGITRGGILHGRFMVRKRGQNYGVRQMADAQFVIGGL